MRVTLLVTLSIGVTTFSLKVFKLLNRWCSFSILKVLNLGYLPTFCHLQLLKHLISMHWAWICECLVCYTNCLIKNVRPCFYKVYGHALSVFWSLCEKFPQLFVINNSKIPCQYVSMVFIFEIRIFTMTW